jgi:hypothetical protein
VNTTCRNLVGAYHICAVYVCGGSSGARATMYLRCRVASSVDGSPCEISRALVQRVVDILAGGAFQPAVE